MMERRLALALAAGLALPAALSFTELVEPAVAVARPSERTERVGIEDAILGAWEGEGTLFGRPARFEMVWAPVLGEAFLGLDYRIEGDVAMEARGFYRMAEGGAVHGTWIDSRGEILALRGLASDSTLEIEWTSPTETGRTAYRLVSDGRIEATDSVRGSEGWRPFGRAVYTRRGTP